MQRTWESKQMEGDGARGRMGAQKRRRAETDEKRRTVTINSKNKPQKEQHRRRRGRNGSEEGACGPTVKGSAAHFLSFLCPRKYLSPSLLEPGIPEKEEEVQDREQKQIIAGETMVTWGEK